MAKTQLTETKVACKDGRFYFLGDDVTNHLRLRLQMYSMPEPNTGCHLWIGAVVPRGYGKIGVQRSKQQAHVYAHRVAFALKEGYWPENARHMCDVPACCNDAHIIEGTHQDNVDDKVARNRQLRGEHIHNSVLHDTDIREIVRCIIETSESMSSIARRYGVPVPAITTLRDGDRWRGVITDDMLERMLVARPKLVYEYSDD